MKYLLSTRQHDPVSVALVASEVGFDGIELVMPNRRDQKERKSLPPNGVTRAQVIHAPNDYYDAARFRSALTDAIQVAKTKQATIVNIHPPSAAPQFGGRKNVEDGILFMRECHRQNPGIVICCEVLAKPSKSRHYQEVAYNDPDAWLEDMVKHQLKATVDTTHIETYGKRPADYIRRLGSLLGHVHLSDYRRHDGTQHLFPKEGDIEWGDVFLALEENNNPNLAVTFEPSGKFDLSKRKEKEKLRESFEFVKAFCF